MKAMISTFSVLAVAVVTGIVLAKAPNVNRSTESTADSIVRAASVDDDEHPVLGRVLFEHVTSVHFCSATFPPNNDGSLGGWIVGDDESAQSNMTIYENYIVKDYLLPDGTLFRESRPYDTLGNIEQRIPRGTLKPKQTN
ncbi:hypothetical protein [uncultured Rubinisphaera sp.]|uniref:hypothetical protein n=1 Tax=uncultured Rubinisphaera sp. TaxID=1678686 RepID=UPI0030DCE291